MNKYPNYRPAEIKALKYINTQKKVTKTQLAQYLNVSDTRAYVIIRNLAKEKKIKLTKTQTGRRPITTANNLDT